MAKNIPWNSRITWYYYNDKELEEYTQKDFEKEAKEMSDLGIDIIMLSNKTHFRFNYYPYWDNINETLGKIVRAFHRYDIKVVEHHSCSLTHVPLPKEEWDNKKDRICDLNNGKKFSKDWQKAKEYITSDSKIEGVPVSSFLQIHGGTHELAPTQYDTHVVCYNNEDYRRIYFNYLESIYELGVDGIMTDDVQFFADGNSCACPTCRKLFKEQTGYEMPKTTKEWNEDFFGNFDDPRFVAFDQFRRNSAIRFQRDVDAHFRSLGLNLLRPNYISNEIMTNFSAYPFSNCADLWDVMFQENVSNSIIRYSWPYYACEAVHRYAFASQNDIPSMSMFYCSTPSDMHFSFSLCLSWGQLFNPSFTRTKDMVKSEGDIRSFEKQYPELVYDQKKKSDIACMFSMKTRDLVANAGTEAMPGVMTWLQTAYFTKKTPGFVLEEQNIEEWQNEKVIVLPHVFMMSDEELRRAGEYAKAGGTLVVVDLCGIKTPEGKDRTLEEIQQLLGCKTKMRRIKESSAKVDFNGELLDEMTYSTAYDNTTSLAKLGDDTVIAKEEKGDGLILFVGGKTNRLPFQRNVSVNREKGSKLYDTGTTQLYSGDILKNTIGKIMDYVVKCPGISVNSEDYLLALYESADKNHTMAHVVNIDKTVCKQKDVRVAMDDPVEQYVICDSTKKNEAFTLTFKCEYKPKAVRLLSLEWKMKGKKAERNADFTYKDGKVSVKVEQNTFAGYIMADAIR